jgi:prepilin peptidase CpaA
MDMMLLIILAVSFYTDLRYNKIYNWTVIPATILALGYHIHAGGLPELWWSIKGLILGMSLLLIPFILGGMGAGDVKLLGFIGACGGPGFVWLTFLATALAGGLLALVILIKEKKLLSSLKAVWYTFISLLGTAPRVNMLGTLEAGGTATFPYGVAITAGTLMAYLMR